MSAVLIDETPLAESFNRDVRLSNGAVVIGVGINHASSPTEQK